NLLKITTLLPGSQTGEWANSYKVENSYNTSNLETDSHDYSWESTSGSWINKSRDTSAYDGNNNLILYTRYTWNNTGSTWDPSEKHDIIYDLYNDPVTETDYRWTTDRWAPSYKYGFTCDASFSRSSLILPDFWINYPMFIHMLNNETVYFWDEDTNEFIPVVRAIYNYSDFSSGIDQPTVSQIKVFPNPASGVIIIESGQPLEEARFDLFDVQGRKVLSKTISGSRLQLPISEIAGGFYYYRISKSKTMAEGKVMIR
ncbi:MAG: T9SS type A sorting domain-containing protein, partial [Bacteroidales bacterium]|nr:T9SS type A sorting domain-containing protein [Bacteroidales bacterium]